MKLQTLAEVATSRPRSQPKRQSRLAEKAEKHKADEKALADFRAAVLKRDAWTCRVCYRKVHRSLELVPLRAEVHHLVPRSISRSLRYSASHAICVCAECHLKLTRHEIEWEPKAEAP